MKTIAECLAANVKRYRKSLKLTQEALAECTDLSLPSIQRIEGKLAWPELDTLRGIAHTLSIPETALFHDPDLKPDPITSLEVIADALGIELPTDAWKKAKVSPSEEAPIKALSKEKRELITLIETATLTPQQLQDFAAAISETARIMAGGDAFPASSEKRKKTSEK